MSQGIFKSEVEKRPRTVKSAFREDHYIVAIGASAGGLEAIHELFDNIPKGTGLSYIIIQHLSPDYKSLLAELVGKHTIMKVVEAEDGVILKPDHVYVIPTKKIMTVKHHKLRLTEKIPNNVPNTAIDVFLKSLAEEMGKKAVAVILSGTGTDGTKGAEVIKRCGGFVIAQEPTTAKFDGMPNSLISSGIADAVLSPSEIPDEIINYTKEAPLYQLYSGQISKKDEKIFVEILQMILEKTSCDFTLYKRPTITRRITKRMAQTGFHTLAEYKEFLVQTPDEVTSLCKEFLIGVTRFFRDPEAFITIQKTVIPEIIKNKGDNDVVKVWVPACSTGEEPYSIAIALRDYIEKNYPGRALDVKIFATDIDKDACEFASKGVYSENISHDIPAEYLEKYFIKEGRSYIINPHIRKMVIFAHHDITRDTPFIKMDLVSCRNMLIYMNPVLQKKVLAIMHFSLNVGGYFVMGSSENPGDLRPALDDVDKKWKIYKVIEPAKPGDSSIYPSRKTVPASVSRFGNNRNPNAGINELFSEILGEHFGYAGIYIDENYELKHAVGNYKRFIDFPEGKLNFNLLRLVTPELSAPIGTAIRRAIKKGETVEMNNIKIRSGDEVRIINILVKPFNSRESDLKHVFILLNEFAPEKINEQTTTTFNIQDQQHERVNDLELELKETKENLQIAVEELETTNEELQSSNEELLSANEELQSTNEELQSLNEELHTVNTEHQLKIKELIDLNDDLNNYFRSSGIAQIFLDNKMIIRKFTPSVAEQINLIESDLGRPFSHISNNLKYTGIVADIKTVLDTGESFQREVELYDGKYFLMRILPYVRRDKSLDGVVVSFVDITEIKTLNLLLSGVFNSSTSGILAFNAVRNNDKIIDMRVVAANQTSSIITGLDPERILEKMYNEVLTSEPFPELFKRFSRVINSGEIIREEEIFKVDNQERIYEIIAVRMEDGCAVTLTDITEKRNAEDRINQAYEELMIAENQLKKLNQDLENRILERTRELSLSEERFRIISTATNDAIWDLDMKNNHRWWSESFKVLTGYDPAKIEPGNESWMNRIHPSDKDRVIKSINDAIQNGEEQWSTEYRFLKSDGTYANILDRAYILKDEDKRPYRMLGSMLNLTKLREQEKEQKRLASIVENSSEFIAYASLDKKLIYINSAGQKMLGLSDTWLEKGLSIEDLLIESNRKTFRDNIFPVVNEKAHWEGEFQFSHFRTGKPITVFCNLFITVDPITGEPDGYATVTRDISIERNFRKAIIESAEKTRFIANAMPQKVWTADESGEIDYFNQQWIDYSGLEFDDLRGSGWHKLIHPEDVELTLKIWKNSVESEDHFQIEHRIKRTDGEFRWHLTRGMAQKDLEGDIRGWVGTTTDIDEQKKADEKKDEFIGIASHELKTPLTSLKAYTQLVERSLKDDNVSLEKARKYVEKTSTYIDRLNGLVSDLLDVSKIQSGKLSFNFTDFNFHELLEESIESIKHENNGHNISVFGEGNVFVNADRLRMEQVLINFLSNAIKYSPRSNQIDVTVSSDDQHLQVAIKDYGIGIPKDKLINIFKRFYRVEGMVHRFQGLGIGLFISSEIIKRHDGKVWVESEPGDGSTFYFKIPLN